MRGPWKAQKNRLTSAYELKLVGTRYALEFFCLRAPQVACLALEFMLVGSLFRLLFEEFPMTVQLEQGQIVALRRKVWAITGVSVSKPNGGDSVHKVSLECLSDEALGSNIDVIWEREIAPNLIDAADLPKITDFDDPERFAAFLNAIRWSSASLAEGTVLQAPFRGGVQIEEYQLAPVMRALDMPRVTLLIADDVGLGKTIEAGLVAQELIHSHRATKILVLCPAHLQLKWVDEMAEKFGLEFRIIDRDAVEEMRREHGPTINPWASFPRLITSIDYLKRELPRRLFDELLHSSKEASPLKPWHLLILDEAHNCAPAGRGTYIRDSDRTSLLRDIADNFEHKIFLSATPHNGYRESFTGLLELLDNLRFTRGFEFNQAHLDAVTIRRLKDDIKNPDGTRRFAKRVIKPLDEQTHPELYVKLSAEEEELFALLKKYSDSRLSKTNKRNERATQFVLTLLKKRALSSPLAFRESLITHTQNAGVKDELEIGESLFKTLNQKQAEDWSDDDEREEIIDAATAQASRLLVELTQDEKTWLSRMYEIAEKLSQGTDSKAKALVSWFKNQLGGPKTWNGERVILFTEYRHTLEYLKQVLSSAGMDNNIITIYGGMPNKDRRIANDNFQADDSETPARILLATDAASEGADFQRHCRNVIHYDIPWNPVRLEQRNGRVDRHGQLSNEVRIHHFVYKNNEDSLFLKRIVEKVEAIRADLGSVGAVIASNIEKHSLGHVVSLDDVDKSARRAMASQDFQIKRDERLETAEMVRALHEARLKMGISDESQMSLMKHAFACEGEHDAITEQGDGTFFLRSAPRMWRECHRYVSKDNFQGLLTFDRELARSNSHLQVVHLDHPIMRRSISSLRSHMWRGALLTKDDSLRRVTAHYSAVAFPTVLAWGRMLMLGESSHRLHEGLFCAGAFVQDDGLFPVPDQNIDALLDQKGNPFTGDLALVRKLVEPHYDQLHELLKKAAHRKGEELKTTLAARAKTVQTQTRALINERLANTRNTIKALQEIEDTGAKQLTLFDDEKDQLVTDIRALQMRIAWLEDEREQEPARLKKMFSIKETRVYPVALEIFLPTEMFDV